ncbi:MAG: acetyl-CoA carboxylase biotin carboxylase subunit [Lachnospiraceae bacterium]|nr:acetyl-CoA carboxylase biotin carboxylase subunit [Lachnospiraceae bacterium]
MFQKILVANRGEIAVRVIRACREMGIRTVAVYSKADQEALHTQLADESICIGPAQGAESYLNMEQIISATIASKAEAIHPGFGFLSENAKFAGMCRQCQIAFIGPSAEVIHKMGNKAEARKTMKEALVPVIPGTEEAVTQAEQAQKLAEEIGYPIMIKAAFGGGGKGMRISKSREDFAANFQTAQREAEKGFGDGTMYLERYIERPRHIEVQILADKYGNVVHLGERDCSLQMHHQKVLEEAPAVILPDSVRKKMGETAVLAAKAVGYENAGTIEFLYEGNGTFYFMEMNTRIQVEHPITEMVTGVDLVKEQIRIAAGEPLSFTQDMVCGKGHAIECRINAKMPGKITNLHLPGGNGIRVDTAIYPGDIVTPYYDSMLVKLIAYDRDRESAIRKLTSALGELVIEGVPTNLDFQYQLVQSPAFIKGEMDTETLEQMGAGLC